MGNFIKKLVFPSQAKKQEGQILLVVILATVVALTVGLSAVSRTITNTRISTEEANSQKALSAAEAGIEQLLGDPGSIGVEKKLSNEANVTASANAVQGTEFPLNDGNTILKDDGADIWLTESPDFNNPVGGWSGSIEVYWTSDDPCTGAAMEVVVIEGNRSDPSIKRVAADPCPTRDNSFDEPFITNPPQVDGKSYNYSITIPITNGYVARVIPLYENTEMAVSATSALPVQGYSIESVGTSGDTVRKLRVYQANPRVPIEFFPYNVFLP